MIEAKIALLAISAILFAVMLAVALAVCMQELRAGAARRRRPAPRKRALYAEDIRKG